MVPTSGQRREPGTGLGVFSPVGSNHLGDEVPVVRGIPERERNSHNLSGPARVTSDAPRAVAVVSDVTPARRGGLWELVDADLVRRAALGDTRAFAVLVERYHAPCVRFAQRLLASREDAEEVVQDSFVRAHAGLANYEEQQRFRPWLYRIVLNRCRSRMGVGARLRALFRAGATQSHEEPRDAMDAAWEEREELERGLRYLSADLREAFLLKHVEELSYEEMSEITGANVSALKMRVKRACEQLRREVAR